MEKKDSDTKTQNLESLIEAIVIKRDKEKVKTLLDAGADANANEGTPLRIAAEFGHVGIAELLLDAGADIHANEDEPLRLAVEWEQTDMVKLLLDRGADIHANEDEPLRLAVQWEQTDMVKLLLNEGTDIHMQEDLPIQIAASIGNTGLIALLLNAGAHINARESAPLGSAAIFGHIDASALLLDEGADIYTKNNDSLFFAMSDGHAALCCMLLERGAHIHDAEAARGSVTVNRDVLPADKEKIVRLLENAEKIEKMISEQNKKTGASLPALRRLVYSAAAIGLQAGVTDKLNNFILSSLQASSSYTPLNNKEKLGNIEKATGMEALAHSLKIDAYTNAANIEDMVSEYAEAVLLPHLLVRAGFAENRDRLYAIEQNTLADILESLRPVAVHLLLEKKNALDMVNMAKSWHRPGNSIPDKMRPLRSGTWHKLTEDITTPYTMPVDGEEAPLILCTLSSQKKLDYESKILGHCVGNASFANSCMQGISHILSIQANGIPIATLEVTINEKGLPKLIQFSGQSNKTPPEQAKKAWHWFEKQLQEKNPAVILNPEPKNGWGKKEEKTGTCPALDMIGYEPDPEATEKRHNHLRQHLLLKQPVSATKEPGKQPSLTKENKEKGYRWVNAIPYDSIDTGLLESGGQENFRTLARKLATEHKIPPSHLPEKQAPKTSDT